MHTICTFSGELLTWIKGGAPAPGKLAHMEELDGSLSAQHAQIDSELAAAVAAGRAGRWPQYRRHVAALHEGLAQHMAFEEEAVFPGLEQTAAAAVRELRRQHARLRRHLDALAASAPEKEANSCLAELRELQALLHAHHAAETELDPQYAKRKGR